MRIMLNGRETEIADGASIRDLLGSLGLEGRPVAVERNREVVPRALHATTRLAQGDRVEIVTLVGGG